MAGHAGQLRDLLRLTDAALRAEQARMAHCNREISALQDQIAALKAPGKAAQATESEPDPAQRAGADLRWQMWAEERRKALNLELAKMRAAQDSLRASLATAFGKHQATSALCDREVELRRLKASRDS